MLLKMIVLLKRYEGEGYLLYQRSSIPQVWLPATVNRGCYVLRRVVSTAVTERNIAVRKVILRNLLWLRSLVGAMRSQRSQNQHKSSDQHNQHHQRFEKRRRLKVDVHVGQDTREDEQGSAYGQQPPNDALPIPEKNPDTEQHRQKRNAETAPTPETPIRTDYANAMGDEKSSDTRHGKADEKLAQSTGSASHITD